MASYQSKLADALEVLRVAQERGQHVFTGADFSRTHRERLVRAGFLYEVVRGWYITARPGEDATDTAWVAARDEFVRRYCTARFGESWHLSPELSLLRQAGTMALPGQVLVYTIHGSNNSLALPGGNSLFDYRIKEETPWSDVRVDEGGLRGMSIPVALTRASAQFYLQHPLEARIALAQISDLSDMLRPLLRDGQNTTAGRLAGALRAVGRPDDADTLLAATRPYGQVREENPFGRLAVGPPPTGREAPIVVRLRTLWAELREPIIQAFPAPPGLPLDSDGRRQYLATVMERRVEDTYHSLSIEGYVVTESLIRRVSAGGWTAEMNERDSNDRDALAARGYYEAFLAVQDSLSDILEGASPGAVVERDHQRWYRALFDPAVRAGLYPAHYLAGYRPASVYIRGARHVPPSAVAVRDGVSALFGLLREEPHPAVRSVLGHLLFVYVHPYNDGNGRLARLIMNTQLASGGYPWVVITRDQRAEYFHALDVASFEHTIGPFAQFVGTLVAREMDHGQEPRPWPGAV